MGGFVCIDQASLCTNLAGLLLPLLFPRKMATVDPAEFHGTYQEQAS